MFGKGWRRQHAAITRDSYGDDPAGHDDTAMQLPDDVTFEPMPTLQGRITEQLGTEGIRQLHAVAAMEEPADEPELFNSQGKGGVIKACLGPVGVAKLLQATPVKEELVERIMKQPDPTAASTTVQQQPEPAARPVPPWRLARSSRGASSSSTPLAEAAVCDERWWVMGGGWCVGGWLVNL